MELIDAASDEAKQVAVRASGAGARMSIDFGVKVVGSTASMSVSVLHALLHAARQADHDWRTTGKISVRDFGRALEGGRELVGIDDREVARELESTLKRYGVTFAVEPNRDGSRTFHVRGKDVQVVEHALSVASERVDEKISRNATRRRNSQKIEEGVAKKQAERAERKRSRAQSRGMDTPAPSLGDEAPERSGRAR